MIKWLDIVEGIEALDGLTLNGDLVAALERRGSGLSSLQAGIRCLYTHLQSVSDVRNPRLRTQRLAGDFHHWLRPQAPVRSLQGEDTHAMIPARTLEELWRVVQGLVADGAQGMLLTGGSNHRNEVEYDPYYPVVRRI